MTVLTRWYPFRELSNFQDRMNRLFQDFGPGREDELMTTGNFIPPVDVYEDEHAITLKLEVPGVEQRDIDVRLENNTLTIRGERKFEKEEKEENFHRIERRYGSFARSFALPNTVDPEQANAEFENGVLKIRLAKKAEAKPKQIKVGIGTGKQIEGKSAEKGAGKAA
ncbi:MAG: Hsp20/alpha crystallin family protein [Acidobacteriia bacterium]|nr:Hsp20/alpha crystallin family protein [Terriglobia bacterium]